MDLTVNLYINTVYVIKKAWIKAQICMYRKDLCDFKDHYRLKCICIMSLEIKW